MTPVILKDYASSWAQYTIQLKDKKTRDGLQLYLKEQGIPSMIHYRKPMHRHEAFRDYGYKYNDDMYSKKNQLCETVLSLTFYPYMQDDEIDMVCDNIKEYLSKIYG